MRKQLFILLLISCFSIQAMCTTELDKQIRQLNAAMTLNTTNMVTSFALAIAVLDAREDRQYPPSSLSRIRKLEAREKFLRKALELQNRAFHNYLDEMNR